MFIDWEWVGLSVENPLVQRQKAIVGKDQVQVLQCFSQEEALLNVVLLWTALVNITQTGVATICATVFFQGLLESREVIYQWDSNTKKFFLSTSNTKLIYQISMGQQH